MQFLETPDAMQQLSERWRCEGRRLGFVPTMGALHEGHLSLLRQARAECDTTVASIFVNPLQFGSGEDFDKYPRPIERDRALLEEAGCDALFAPTARAMYGKTGAASLTRVDVVELSTRWEGEARPGHFAGVATVVAKLFNIVRPHCAYFGEKDFQQLAIIRQMTHDLNFGVEIVPVPTVREADGLALSSRNVYLAPEQRQAASVLNRALQAGVLRAQQGEADGAVLEKAMRAICRSEPLVDVQYLAVVDAATLEPLARLDERAARVLVAARIGQTRLIDNVEIRLANA